LIYLNGSHSLIVFTEAGIKKKEYKIGDKVDDHGSSWLTRMGAKLLMLTGSKLYHVELPKK